jgi:T-complex protein 1 subunit eta
VERLRQKHHEGEKWAGVDITKEGIIDSFKECVWEPTLIKINAISSATEAACLILSIDETVKTPQVLIHYNYY